jgi:hypothetical protein
MPIVSSISRFFSRMSLKREALRQVESLKQDLSAEIVIEEDNSNTASQGHTNRSWGDRDSGGYGAWGESSGSDTPEAPVKTKPDAEKRESARRKLQQLRDLSEWECVRRAADEALASQ